MRPDVVGIPIKPFGIAKARLAPILDASARAELGRAIGAHTARVVRATGADPWIVTGDAGVTAWAIAAGWDVIEEPQGGGLDGAAAAVIAHAGGGTWAVLHADLPTVTVDDLSASWCRLGRHGVIAPSRDGGTSLIAGAGTMRFAFGPGSFHRHLRRMPHAAVVTRPGLALDLDTADDLALALQAAAGGWLRSHLPSPVQILT